MSGPQLKSSQLAAVVAAVSAAGIVGAHSVGSQRKADTFIGSEFVTCLVRLGQYARSRKAATSVGQQLIGAGLAYNLSGEPRFADDVSFYRFTDKAAGYMTAARPAGHASTSNGNQRLHTSSAHSSPFSTSAAKPIAPPSPTKGGDGGPRTPAKGAPGHRATASAGASSGSSGVRHSTDRRHHRGASTPGSSGRSLGAIGSGRSSGSRSVGGDPASRSKATKALSPAEWMRSTSPGSQASAPPLTASPALFGTPVSQGLGFSPAVTVTVVDAETREDSSGRYTAFRVAVHNGMRQWTVARRYSEFRSLHTSLSAEFPNTRLPKMPPKKYIGVMDPRFVAERKEALMRYMNELVQVPAVWQSNDLISFLDDSANSLGIQVTLERMQQRVVSLEQVCADHQHQLRRYDQLFRRQVSVMERMKRRIVALESHASVHYTADSVASAISAVSPPTSLASARTGISARTAPPTTGHAYNHSSAASAPGSYGVTSPHSAATAGSSASSHRGMGALGGDGVGGAASSEAAAAAAGTAIAASVALGGLGGRTETAASSSSAANLHDSTTSALSGEVSITSGGGGATSRAMNNGGADAALASAGTAVSAAPPRPPPTSPKAISRRARNALADVPSSSPGANGSFQLPTPSSAMLKGIVTPPWRRRSDSNPWGGTTVAVASPDVASLVDESIIPSNRSPSRLDHRVTALLSAMQANEGALASRQRVCSFISRLLKKALGAQAFPVGPHPLHVCVPEDELQLSAFLCHGQERTWFVRVSEVLCMASSGVGGGGDDGGDAGGGGNGGGNGGGGSRRNRSRSRSDSSADKLAATLAAAAEAADADGGACVVSAVNFVNGPTRHVKCSVDGITVDVSANQLSDLCLVAVLEKVDMAVGQDHLFKRSALLIKSWCMYESRNYAGWSAMSTLPWRALATLVVWVFARRSAVLFQPLQALAWFLLDCARFPWHTAVLTIHGPVPLAGGDETAVRAAATAGVNAVASGHDGGGAAAAPEARGYGVEHAVPASALARVIDPAYLREVRAKCCRRHGVDARPPAATGGMHDSQSSQGSSGVATSGAHGNGVGGGGAFASHSTGNDGDGGDAGGGGSGDGDASFAEVPPDEFAVSRLNISDILIPTRNLGAGITPRQAVRVQQLLSMGAKNLAPVLKHAAAAVAAGAPPGLELLAGPAASVDAGTGAAVDQNEPASRARLDTFFASSWQRFGRNHRAPPVAKRGSNIGGGGGGGGGGDSAAVSTEWVRRLAGNLAGVVDSVNYCLCLLDAEVTAPALLSLASQILTDKGRLPVGEIGKLLQEATANPSLSATLKEEFGGLKKFLENYPDTFLISNDHPFNPHVYLRTALSSDEVASILSGASSSPHTQRRKKASRRGKKGQGHQANGSASGNTQPQHSRRGSRQHNSTNSGGSDASSGGRQTSSGGRSAQGATTTPPLPPTHVSGPGGWQVGGASSNGGGSAAGGGSSGGGGGNTGGGKHRNSGGWGRRGKS